MRNILTILLFGALTVARAQQSSGQLSVPSVKLKPQSPRTYYKSAADYRSHLVARMLREPEPLTFTIVLHWLGDEASADIMQILNNTLPITTADQLKILDMIHASFEAPQCILDSENRTPTAVLKLLDGIASVATDPSVKDRVTTERAFAYYSTTMPLHQIQSDPTKPPPPHPPVVITPN